MSLQSIQGSWRLSWTPRRTYKAPFSSNLKQLTYELLPSEHVTVHAVTQNIDPARREWTDTAYMRFDNGFFAAWRMEGLVLDTPVRRPDPAVIDGRPRDTPALPLDIEVCFVKAVLQSRCGSKAPPSVVPFLDRTIALNFTARSQVVVLTDTSRIDKDPEGTLVMFSRDLLEGPFGAVQQMS